jgi:hypothetical protein
MDNTSYDSIPRNAHSFSSCTRKAKGTILGYTRERLTGYVVGSKTLSLPRYTTQPRKFLLFSTCTRKIPKTDMDDTGEEFPRNGTAKACPAQNRARISSHTSSNLKPRWL